MVYRLILLLSGLFSLSESGKFLFWPSTINKVHPYTLKFLVNELSKRNHEITWIEHGFEKSEGVLSSNIKQIFWKIHESPKKLENENYEKIWNENFNWPNEQFENTVLSLQLCENLLSNYRKEFESIIQKQHFDAIIIDDLYNPCGILFAGLKGDNLVLWSQTSMRPESAWAHQSPFPPSYLPAPRTGYTDEMSFFERLQNIAHYFKELFIEQHIVQPMMDEIFKKVYSDVPPTFDILRNASLNYINNPPIFDFPRAYMPRVNYVGCLHCREAETLPKEFGDFIRKSEKFIVISGGFTARWKILPEYFETALLQAFERFPKINFVWQYDGALSKLPKNVMTQNWLPLQDLLGHSKCKAHISHGGLNSVMESVYYGVPVIGIPFTASGYDNLLRVTSRKTGIMVTKSELKESRLISAIENIDNYKEEMLEFQDFVRDVPVSALDYAVFWLEFIERHGEIPHARSGADKLNILQYFLIDIITFLLSIAILSFMSIVFVVKRVYRLLKFVTLQVLKLFSKKSIDSAKKRE